MNSHPKLPVPFGTSLTYVQYMGTCASSCVSLAKPRDMFSFSSRCTLWYSPIGGHSASKTFSSWNNTIHILLLNICFLWLCCFTLVVFHNCGSVPLSWPCNVFFFFFFSFAGRVMLLWSCFFRWFCSIALDMLCVFALVLLLLCCFLTFVLLHCLGHVICLLPCSVALILIDYGV